MTTYLPEDPRGLIHEAYCMEIGIEDARSIFFDWALADMPADAPKAPIEALLACYAEAYPGHPMTDVLREGLAHKPPAKRRGGRAARVAPGSGD